MIFVYEDLQRIVTTNMSSATMTIADKSQRGDWDETVVAVGRGAEGFDVSSHGKETRAVNAQDATCCVVDAETKKATQTLAANVQGANRLKFTPDGKLVDGATLRGPDLAIFDAATRKEVKR